MLLKNSSQSLQRPRKGLLSRQNWGGVGALDSHLSQHARPCPCVPTKGACRAGAAPPSCRSTAWGQAQESSRDTDPEQGRSRWTGHLEMSKWRGVQETIGFLYGKRGSDLWEPWVSPGSKGLTWAPLLWGSLEIVPMLWVSLLQVPHLRSLLCTSPLCGSILWESLL